MRVNYRKLPSSSGSQRHAKLGKRPRLPKQTTVGDSAVDEVTHKTKVNKSGAVENITG